MPMSHARWFALSVRANRESVVADILQSKGYEVFSPVYRSRRVWSDRIKELDLPLFAGYIFSRFDLAQRTAPVLTTPGVVRVIGFGGRAVPLDEQEIEAVRTIVNSGVPAQPLSHFSSGDKVRIMHGPLAGLEGTLIEAKKRHQLVVSISLLQRSVSVDIDRAWVQPVLPSMAARCA